MIQHSDEAHGKALPVAARVGSEQLAVVFTADATLRTCAWFSATPDVAATLDLVDNSGMQAF